MLLSLLSLLPLVSEVLSRKLYSSTLDSDVFNLLTEAFI